MSNQGFLIRLKMQLNQGNDFHEDSDQRTRNTVSVEYNPRVL